MSRVNQHYENEMLELSKKQSKKYWDEQIRRARKEVDSWSEEKRKMMVLEGGDKPSNEE